MSEPLEEIQDRILDRLHAGEAPDRDALLAAHPEHASALGRFLDLLRELEAAPPPASRQPARLGEFRVLRELGRGGMGIVYEAEQASLRRRVALKVLPPALGRDPRVVARFRREAEAAGRLRHPGIVPVFSVGETAGTPFFAMELVEGRSLADAIRDRQAGKDAGLPPAGEPWRRWAVETVARIADALHYAHGEGILHRDVKPGNILIEKGGAPRLTDFGLAMDLAAPGLTATGETFGTPLYMSPEQALRREAPLDPRTDVYSLGVTLYEALTLRTPYEGTSTPEILTALHQGRIVPPRTADEGMPEPLERIVLQALRRAPEDRYADAGAMATDLRNWLGSRPVEAAPPPPPAPAEPVRREVPALRTAATWVLAASVLLGVAVVSGMFSKSRTGGAGDGTAAAGAAIAFRDLVALAEGKHPGGEAALRAWVRPQVRMRNLVARASLGEYACVVQEGPYREPADDDVGIAVLARFEASVDRGPWKELPGTTFLSIRKGGLGTMSIAPSLAATLGDAVRKGSVNLRHRARCRILPWSGRESSVPPAPVHGVDPVQAAWAAPGGTSCTWEEERTLVIYDEYPADYPELVADATVDGRMIASLTPRVFGFPSVDATGAVQFALEGATEAGPLPVAGEFELLDAVGERVLSTTKFEREGSGPDSVPNPAVSVTLGLRFPAPAASDEGGVRYFGDLVARRVASVRLRFRPSRAVALEQTVFERIWGRTFELVVPAAGAGGGAKTEARIVEPEPQMSVSVSMDGDGQERFTRSALLRLADGKPRKGDPSVAEWVDVRIPLPSKYAPYQGGPRYNYECRADLKPATTSGTGEPGEDVLVLALWERALGSGPWTELGITATTLSEGTQSLPDSMNEVEESYRPGTTASIRHRVKLRLLKRPEGWLELKRNLAEVWKLPCADSSTRNQANAMEIVDRYPPDYPEAVPTGRKAEEDEAMARALTPTGARFDAVHVSNEYVAVAFSLAIPGAGPLPAAFEVDGYFAGEERPFGTGEFGLPDAKSLDLAGPRTALVKFRLPASDPVAERGALEFRARGIQDRCIAGGARLRLVLRPSRGAAIRNLVDDRYWGGTLEATVPVGAR